MIASALLFWANVAYNNMHVHHIKLSNAYVKYRIQY
jgi:hypothetical protein